MTELRLYRFIKDYSVEYHWHGEEVFMFVNYPDIENLVELLDSSIFDDEGLDCTMKEGYFCYEMVHICEYYGIHPGNIFNKDN